ncbi:unnamed protein product [Gongylonema pulchrum]|uniref:Conserved plasma membrane protein n=1 Tax=Gongylonema pulchrum TaxID=637853 RepID=A0A183ESM5_9BILA|nr:unnamed protein product [Gongylonema pulchrum]
MRSNAQLLKKFLHSATIILNFFRVSSSPVDQYEHTAVRTKLICKRATFLAKYILKSPKQNRTTVFVQCDLPTEDHGLCVDPMRLSYKQRLRWHIKEFCYKTSIHGVPMLEQAPNTLYRVAWVVLLISCACMFLIQAVSVVAKYNRNEKITNIELKFDTGNARFTQHKDFWCRGCTAVTLLLVILHR